MSRKDYELIAGVLRRSMNDHEGLVRGALVRLARDMASELRMTNPRFNEYRFLTACRLTDSEIVA